jgi:hypothetical protein
MLRTLSLAILLTLACVAVAGILAGCGGGSPLTAEEIAQHDADKAALAALSQDRKTIQPITCAPACAK